MGLAAGEKAQVEATEDCSGCHCCVGIAGEEREIAHCRLANAETVCGVAGRTTQNLRRSLEALGLGCEPFARTKLEGGDK